MANRARAKAAAGRKPVEAKKRAARGAKDGAAAESVQELLERFIPALLDRSLTRVGELFLLQALEWQSMVLDLYRHALKEGAFDVPIEDHLRATARSMLRSYLDLVKTIPEQREHLLTLQAELAKGFTDAVDELRRRVTERGR
jgi:hypothetical protein